MRLRGDESLLQKAYIRAQNLLSVNDIFWVDIFPALAEEMLDCTATKIESFLGTNF